MKIFIVLLVAFVGAVHAAESQQFPGNDNYQVDEKTQGLKVIWANGSALVKGVVGDIGEITRNLVDFNGGKALHYENLASRSQFEAYITVKRLGDELFIDCVYGNIRSEQNGALISKAVCGLGNKLAANYEQIIYEYSDRWKKEVELVDMSPLLKDFPTDVSVEEGRIRDVTLTRLYTIQNDLVVDVPRVRVERNGKVHDFGHTAVFTVYDKSDLMTPVYVEVVAKRLEAPFQRVDYKMLKGTLN